MAAQRETVRKLTPQGPWGTREGRRQVRALALLALLVAALGGVLVRAPIAPLDTGHVLVGADLVRRGYVPDRDFVSPYGPLNHTLVALVEWVAPGVVAERCLGLGYRFVLCASVFVLLDRRARVHAWIGSTLALALTLATGTDARAWWGGMACLALALALLTGRPSQRWGRALGGLCAGLTTAFRPDLAVAALALPAACAISARRVAGTPFVGFALGVVPLLGSIARMGLSAASLGLVQEPRRWAASRVLPFPPHDPWLLAATLAVVGAPAALLASVVRRRRRGSEHGDGHPAEVLPACVGFALLPQALQRADGSHLAYVGALTVPMVLAMVPVVGPRARSGTAAVAALLVVLTTRIGLLPMSRTVSIAVGRLHPEVGIVQSGHRWLPIDSVARARDLNALLAELRRRARPGQRLFVGPEDLRRTCYSDAYLYWMMPQLEPAGRLSLLNPTTDPAQYAALARDVSRADFLLLTSAYDGWREANDSRRYGPRAATDVVRAGFCSVATAGDTRLLARCAR